MRANLFSPEFDHASEREGFRWRGARIGRAIGAEQVGGSLYQLGDGERTYPFHFHHGLEEWAIVISGAPTLRDVIPFPKTNQGTDQMTSAPVAVDAAQLAEVFIKSTPP